MPIKAPRFNDRLATYEAFCSRENLNCADVALAWVLSNPVVTAPIVRPRTIEQLERSVQALNIKLAAAQLAELDAIFPGPGGEAPEAYAW